MIGNRTTKEIVSRFFQQDHRFVVVLFLILAVGIPLQWSKLDTLVWGSDEGIHLSAAYLVNQGLEPYRNVSFSQGPLFLEMVRWPLHWWGGEGNDVTGVRLAMLAFGLANLIAVALIGRELKNNLTGWAAALLLLATPSFFYFARAVMADGPAIALAMWAAWMALRYVQQGKRPWLIGSGILLGLSLATKFLTLYAVAWIALLLVYRNSYIERPPRWQVGIFSLLRDWLAFCTPVIGVVLVIYAWYDLPTVIKSVFGMRVAMRDAFGSWPANNQDEIIEFWSYHRPLLIFALFGFANQLRQRSNIVLLSSWILLIVASLRVQNPLYHQHMQLLLPPVALLAAMGLAALAAPIYRQRSHTLQWLQRVAAIGLVWSLWFSVLPANIARTDNRYREISTTGLRAGQDDIVEFIRKFSAPSDCLITDDLNLAFISRRFPPAMLIDLSSARLATDSISDERLERITLRSACQIVAPLTDRLNEYSPGFTAWSAAIFLGDRENEDGSNLLLAQPITMPRYQYPAASNFGDQLHLQGLDLDVIQTEQVLYISLYWQSQQPLQTDYKIFVHLRDTANNTIVNGDHYPYDNLLPTTDWPEGRTIKETIRLTLPTADSLSNYRLFIGVYHPESQERLIVEDDKSGENAIIIPVAWDLL